MKRISAFCLALATACACGADAPVDASLSDVPAEVVFHPTGTLSCGQAYQGTPSSVVSASGKRTFVAWYGGGIDENLDNYVMLAYVDGSPEENVPVRVVVRSPHIGRVRCCDPCLWREPSGRIWFSWCQTAGENLLGKRDERGNRNLSEWGMYTDYPDDAEPQWSAPRKLFHGNMMNKPLYSKNGYAYYCICVPRRFHVNDLRSLEEGLWIYRSNDGMSFEKISHILLPSSATESMLVEKENGDIWLWSRVDPLTLYSNFDKKSRGYKPANKPTDGIYEAFSQDGGFTFTRALPSKVPQVGSRFHIARLASGNLLLLKNYANDERWLAGKPKAKWGEGDAFLNLNPKARKKIIAYLSDDDGKTWKGGLVLDTRKEVSYPDASQDADGFIYVSWDRERYNEPEILLAKFTEADVLAGEFVSEGSVPATVINKGPLGKTARARSRVAP